MNLSTMSDAELEAWREFYEGRETDEAREFMRAYRKEVSLAPGSVSARAKRWLDQNVADIVMDVWEERHAKDLLDEATNFKPVFAHPNGTCECGTRLEWERVSGGYRLWCRKCRSTSL